MSKFIQEIECPDCGTVVIEVMDGSASRLYEPEWRADIDGYDYPVLGLDTRPHDCKRGKRS